MATAMHVLIIGAGSTGLLLAQALAQKNVRTTVFEREDSSSYQTRPREWGMTLHWGAEFINKCIPPELRPKLNEGICCDPFYGNKDLSLPHYNGQTGEKLFDMPGNEPRRISRRKLRTFLSQGIDVQYGKRISDITLNESGDVVAIFTDQTSVTGTVLVGCDGANSAVRPLLVGAEAAQNEDLDMQAFNLSCSFPREVALLQRMGHPIFKNSYHPEGLMWWQSIQDVQDPDKPETWQFQNILSWIGAPRAGDFADQKARIEYWREKAQLFADPWKTVGAHLRDDLVFGVDHTTVWRPVDWSDRPLASKVTLAGDAAHAMPAHRGQGLNQALEDAAALGTQLALVADGSKTLSMAVQDYETEMRARVLTEIPISVAQAQMVHSFDTLLQAPFFTHGMHKYREERERHGEGIEVATDVKVMLG